MPLIDPPVPIIDPLTVRIGVVVVIPPIVSVLVVSVLVARILVVLSHTVAALVLKSIHVQLLL